MKFKLVPLLVILSLFACEQRITQNPSPQTTPSVIITASPSAEPTLIPVPGLSPSPVETSQPTISASASVTVDPSSNLNSSPAPTASPTIIPVKSNRILFDTSINPFNSSSEENIQGISKLTQILEDSNYTVLFDSIANRESLNDIDTILIISPSKDYSDIYINRLNSFVASGKKVFIAAEWGGYGNFSASAVNKLLKDANLRIDEDVVKEMNQSNYDQSDEQLLISDISSHPITKGISDLAFYSSASVNLINTQNMKSKIVASSSLLSFAVKANTYKSGVVAASELGTGKIIVSGDSSFLLDSDSNDNGVSNIDELNNKNLILNILKW